MAAALQIFASIIISTIHFQKDTINGFVILAVICNFGRAWLAPAIECIMVNQMKTDPHRGSEDI